VKHVNAEIAAAVQEMEAMRQEKIDGKMIELDGTTNKGRINPTCGPPN